MDLTQLTEQLKSLDSKVLAALIAAIVSIVVAFFNYLNQRKSLKLQAKQIAIMMKETKIKKLRKQLDEFYIPFDQYLSKTTEFYKNFRHGLPTEFRTLVYLIDNRTEFKNSDGVLEIAKVGEDKMKLLEIIFNFFGEMQKLIIEKSALIEDISLIKEYNPDINITDTKLMIDYEQPSSIPKEIGLLTLFSIHIDYMKMAYEGQVSRNELDIVKNYVYPRELNKKIKDNINKLREEIKELSK